ncbi:hypothetical protein [Bosea lathyri]|uniref:hypothetical protein n=1 Tax=Bosea lathyri TaxID=1036778 RepID=UPI001356B578|nr:hypothetical protein [Bosea lathyri]
MFAQFTQHACDQGSTDQFGGIGDQFGHRFVDERLGGVEDAEHGLDHTLDIGIAAGSERQSGQRIHFLPRQRQRTLQIVHGFRERLDRRCSRQCQIGGGPKLAQPLARGAFGEWLFAQDAIGRSAFGGNTICRVNDVTEGHQFRKAVAVVVQFSVVTRDEGEAEREGTSQYDNNGHQKSAVQSNMTRNNISVFIDLLSKII